MGRSSRHADVLLLTVNEYETQAVLQVFAAETGAPAASVTIADRLYRDLGVVSGWRVFHALSEMGSGGPGATQQTVDKAIRALGPQAIVAVGIAFGISEKKQQVGEILVSRHLRLYELQRMGSDIRLRGDKPHASPRLLNLFEGIAQTVWTGPRVTPGTILTGEKLVDNVDYRQQLLSFEPEAIGGEMEGAGLYVASYDHKVDWIVIKAICDWADGHKAKNKAARQKKAAQNAASFVLFALKQAPNPDARRATRTRSPASEDLETLKREATTLLRLIPGAQISTAPDSVAKHAHIYVVMPGQFSPPSRIAVECRTGVLSRAQCASILSNYHRAMERHIIDKIIILTNQPVAHLAREMFDGRRTVHLTREALAKTVLDPAPLVDNMVRMYSVGDLDQFYVSQWGYAPPLRLAREHYSHLYNDFMDFALASGARDYRDAMANWLSSSGDQNSTPSMSEGVFQECLKARQLNAPISLESYVLDWLSVESPCPSLAVLGSYGTGKSSFAKRIAHVCATRYRQGLSTRVPFLIELKEFGGHQDIAGLVTHELVNRHRIGNGSFEVFRELNAAGQFFIILDGFDEMKQGMTADSLLYNFFQISSLSEGSAKVLICGRPTIFENELEQSRILKGDISAAMPKAARYVQIEIAPFSVQEACHFLKQYTQVTDPANANYIEMFTRDLEYDSSQNSELRELIRRPVHLPMLATVAPRLRIRAANIQRATLYGTFIDAIIEREMLKRPGDFRNVYSVAARRDFAVSVAVQMFRDGESRAIRTAEIPDVLFEAFVGPGRPKDAVKRDLIAACFLERKPPDILYFPHKSFLEYLIAVHVARVLADSKETPEFPFEVSMEILAFVSDIMSSSGWINVIRRRSALDARFLKTWLGWLKRDCIPVPPDVESALAQSIALLPRAVRTETVDLYETLDGELRPAGLTLLQKCVADGDDVVSVHAYRALEKRYTTVPSLDLIETLGRTRALSWCAHGWLHESVADEVRTAIARAELVGILAAAAGAQAARALMDVLSARAVGLQQLR